MFMVPAVTADSSGLTWSIFLILSNVVKLRATWNRCTNKSMNVQVSCNEPQAFVMIVSGSFENSAQSSSLSILHVAFVGGGSTSISEGPH